MINFFRPLNIPLQGQNAHNSTAIQEAYHNTAGFLHDIKKTWQLLCPIPLRHMTSVIYDLLTLKTRPQELLMSDSEHFRECLRTNIGDFTFQEAFDRTGRILNIVVTRKYSCFYASHLDQNRFFVKTLYHERRNTFCQPLDCSSCREK